jgi:hypothetical protein
MANKFITADLGQVVKAMSIAGITLWNRLEGRPRAAQFDRALRDALWMLARQWQMSEFKGDDAGSPVLAKVRLETAPFDRYQPASGPAQPIEAGAPLEAQVERMPLPLSLSGRETALDLRLAMGRQWLRMIGSVPAQARAAFLAKYPIHVPDPANVADASSCAHPEAWSMASAVAGRRMDGAKLYAYLKADAAHRASDGIAGLGTSAASVDSSGTRFVRWVERVFGDPAASPSWLPERLEYAFACTAPQSSGTKVLACDQYYDGRLDWHNFDVDPAASVPANAGSAATALRTTLSMLPTQAAFPGMPNSRWWAFEDGKTSFADVAPDTTDLAKLLLVEFALVYSNDWLVVPCTVPAGCVANVRGLVVTDVFGERRWIEPAGRGDDDVWQRWAMFLMSTKGNGHEAADTSLTLPPSAQAALAGPPLEAVLLARDETANMVWAVEQTIMLPTGEGKPGRRAADETRAYFERDLANRPSPPPPERVAPIRYELMSSVPENWIPLLPVHVAGSNRTIQLQRGAMPRVLAGDPDPPQPVRPRTSLLRQGLDGASPAPYFLHEEEVPRAGIRVLLRYRRARGRDGRAWLWLGITKQAGRGESSSGLAFDRIVDVT